MGELNFRTAREAYVVKTVATCKVCGKKIGQWDEGGMFPKSLTQPCPQCNNDPGLSIPEPRDKR